MSEKISPLSQYIRFERHQVQIYISEYKNQQLVKKVLDQSHFHYRLKGDGKRQKPFEQLFDDWCLSHDIIYLSQNSFMSGQLSSEYSCWCDVAKTFLIEHGYQWIGVGGGEGGPATEMWKLKTSDESQGAGKSLGVSEIAVMDETLA